MLSTNGTSADFLLEAEKTTGVTRYQYDHLPATNGVSGKLQLKQANLGWINPRFFAVQWLPLEHNQLADI